MQDDPAKAAMNFPDIDYNLKSVVSVDTLTEALALSPYGYVITKCRQQDNPIIFVNHAFTRVTGYDAQDVMGKSCRFLLREDTKQQSLTKLRKAIKNKRPCNGVVRNYRKDGTLFYNELNVVPILGQTGEVTHLVWSQRDITSSIEKETQLVQLVKQKEERFSAYMQNSSEALWRLDFSPPVNLDTPEGEQVEAVFNRGVYTEANDVAARAYGLKEGREVCGEPLNRFMRDANPKNIETVTQLVRNKFSLRNILSYEKKKDKTETVILNNVIPSIRKREVYHIWGASLVVTELFTTQDDLRKSKEVLSIQKKALEEKNIALKEIISHVEQQKEDFKDRVMANVEQVILPSLDRLKGNGKDDEYIDYIRIALEDLTSSFGRKINSLRTSLSPREIEVCKLVKNGLSNKEIARMLKIALHTVEKHRRSARKKLGLTSKKINLHSYLNSL